MGDLRGGGLGVRCVVMNIFIAFEWFHCGRYFQQLFGIKQQIIIVFLISVMRFNIVNTIHFYTFIININYKYQMKYPVAEMYQNTSAYSVIKIID